MSHSVHVKATHKAIQTYYQTLEDYREHDVGHETTLRSAFQYLLAEIAKTRHWLLVPEQSSRSGGKRVVPDGTLYDSNNLHRGYWEAKDTDDHLDAEIAKRPRTPTTISTPRSPKKSRRAIRSATSFSRTLGKPFTRKLPLTTTGLSG